MTLSSPHPPPERLHRAVRVGNLRNQSQQRWMSRWNLPSNITLNEARHLGRAPKRTTTMQHTTHLPHRAAARLVVEVDLRSHLCRRHRQLPGRSEAQGKHRGSRLPGGRGQAVPKTAQQATMTWISLSSPPSSHHYHWSGTIMLTDKVIIHTRESSLSVL